MRASGAARFELMLLLDDGRPGLPGSDFHSTPGKVGATILEGYRALIAMSQTQSRLQPRPSALFGRLKLLQAALDIDDPFPEIVDQRRGADVLLDLALKGADASLDIAKQLRIV